MRGLLRRAAFPGLVGGVVLGTILILVWLSAQPGDGRRYDPGSTSLNGGRALARLLEDQGVPVERVTEAGQVRGDGLTLVTPNIFLTEEEVAELPGDLLIAGTAAVGAPDAELDGRIPAQVRSPGCELPAARRAGPAHIGGPIFKTPRGTRCYQGSLVRYPAKGRTITLVGDAGFMTNLRLAEEGNAALAMNLAGYRGKVYWLVPGEGGAPLTGRKTLGELIPAGVYWAILQLILAVLVTALWRGRRLGPVVAERLPVMVRAAETTEGRAGLYRARRARDSAAQALRGGVLRRVLPRLGRTAALDEDALYGPVPRDDAELVRLAERLDELERRSR